MRTRLVLLVVALALAGCERLAGARVTLSFKNETKTKCVRVSARATSGAVSNAAPINRTDDKIVVAIAENDELNGEVTITVKRYAAENCPDPEFDTQAQTVTLDRKKVALVEFGFEGDAVVTDGGADAGLDAGVDAGCDVSACVRDDCHVGEPACGCVYAKADAGTPCATGFCSPAGVCGANPCEGQPNGFTCDDGLACTSASSCQGELCTPQQCASTPPECKVLQTPLACDPTITTQCATVNDTDLIGCSNDGKCVAGACLPWFVTPPTNGHTEANELPGYQDAGWVLESPDGGPCETIISTDTATAVRSECGAPPIVSRVDDAGVRVFGMSGLTIGPAARLQFVGTLPAQLLVVGNATVGGELSVAPLTGGAPAGNNPTSCSVAQSGAASKEGGGGGAFGGNGGNGGDSGGAGGNATPPANQRLRGGCSGGSGFLTSGAIAGGGGGGALQLSVTGALTISGVVTASGGGGAAGTADGVGGGGGGSGGMLVLEAKTVAIAGWVTSNGGGGGEGGESGVMSAPGSLGPIASDMPAGAASMSQGGNGGVGGVVSNLNGTNGGNGGGSGRGGGGGGGSVGVVYVRGTTCTGLPHISASLTTMCN